MSFKKISFEVKEKVAWVGFGKDCDKSMTVLCEDSIVELREIILKVKEDQKNLDALIFHTHKDKCFLAGVDINLIQGMKTESEGAHGSEQGQLIYNDIEDLKIPTIALVHGVCVGGGTELVLSCKTILASNDSGTFFGLPEVKLGVLPGFGGTYRMPKKIGLVAALDVILTGKNIKAKKAKKLGLVADIYPKEYLPKMAKNFFKGSHAKSGIMDSIENFATDNFLSKKIIFQKARENVLQKTKGFYQAPLKILDVMESGMMKGRTSYLASESEAFGELCVSEQSKNLVHLFFMVESGKKYPGPKAEEKIPTLKRGACLGAGTMGGGIAWLMADNGMAPIMKDIGEEGLVLGLKQSSKNFMEKVKRKRLSKDEFERKQRSISAQTNYEGFNKTDLVIEAIVENMNVKKSVFAEVEKEVGEDCILTSNTSSLSIEDMKDALEKPQRFAGLHFFNPVNRMPLVEIISHSKVAPETLQSLYEWVLETKKTPVIVKDGPGFLVNRILMPFLNESGFLLEEGVSVSDIDNACLNFGMPMGPCRLLDEIGIDVGVKVAHIIHEGLGDRAKSSSISDKMVENGWIGRKGDKGGFYLYDEKGKVTEENPDLKQILPKDSKKLSEVDIQMRVFLPMINEASTVLEDGIAQDAATVDLSLIFGIGFPPFRGGLLRYADNEGLKRILEALKTFESSVDKDRYAPSAFLKNLVEKKMKFYDL